jgi:hypothetical protein
MQLRGSAWLHVLNSLPLRFLGDQDRRGPAEPCVVPQAAGQSVRDRDHANNVCRRSKRRYLERGWKKAGMHRNAQRTLLFTAGQLGAVAGAFNVRGLRRQQLAMNVRGLRCADDSNEQQTRNGNRPQPLRVRVRVSSVLESFLHVSFRIAGRAPASLAMRDG